MSRTIAFLLGIVLLLVVLNSTQAGGLIPQPKVPLYNIEGTAHIAGKLLEPNIEVQTLEYSIEQAGFLDFSMIAARPFFLDVAQEVSCRALLLSSMTEVKSSGYKSMGSFGVWTDKELLFIIARVPAGQYTLRAECNWKDGGYNKKEQDILVG